MKRRRLLIVIGVVLAFGGFLQWVLVRANRVEIKPATRAQIEAAIEPRLHYRRLDLPYEKNAWGRLSIVFSAPVRSWPRGNYTPPLSLRSMQEIAPFVEECRWSEPELDKALATGQLEAPERFASNAQTFNEQHPFDRVWVYLCQSLAYAQATRDQKRIWPTTRRMLHYARLCLLARIGQSRYLDLQQFWMWPQNMQCALTEPLLTTHQLREALQLLPTEEEVIAAEGRAEAIEFQESVLFALDPTRVEEFEKDYPKADDPRHYYAGELDVVDAIRRLGACQVAMMDAFGMPLAKSVGYVRAVERANMPRTPPFPWPQAKESPLVHWWRDQLYRFAMRGTRNAMIRFLPPFTGPWVLENAASRHFWITAARTCIAVRIYERAYGRRPSRLAELVDKGLLPRIPADPFDGAALRYNGERIWSVGHNFVDDGGYGASSYDKGDLVWSLTPEPPIRIESRRRR